jgi:hypothetical protein
LFVSQLQCNWFVTLMGHPFLFWAIHFTTCLIWLCAGNVGKRKTPVCPALFR